MRATRLLGYSCDVVPEAGPAPEGSRTLVMQANDRTEQLTITFPPADAAIIGRKLLGMELLTLPTNGSS